MLYAGTRCSRIVGRQPFSACKAGAQRIGCNLVSKPSFGDPLAYTRRTVSYRQLRSAAVAMTKVDDPSQAFHSGQAKARSALDEMSTTGEFKRTDSTYRDHIKKGTRFEPEAGRYHLYIAYACPWASRCLAVRNIKGLQDAIGLSVTHSTWQRTKPGTDDEHCGWAFAGPQEPPLHSSTGYGEFTTEGCIPDNVNGAKFVRDLYEKVDDNAGKYTVPVLWDKKEKTIVSNESSEIMRMFNSEFNDIAKIPDLGLT